VHPAVADSLLMTYMRPEHGDLTIHGKLSYDEIVDPDSWNEGADPDQIVKNAELIAHRFPVMEHGLAMGGYSGLYDATPDHHPVLGAVPEYAGLYVDFGWSGHGFKHSPFIGDLMSDLIRQFGSPRLALAAYNAGPAPVEECECVPPYSETQAYVTRILGLLDGAGSIAVPSFEVRLVA